MRDADDDEGEDEDDKGVLLSTAPAPEEAGDSPCSCNGRNGTKTNNAEGW